MAHDDSHLLLSYGASDIGQRRKLNEDAFLRDDDLGLWIVADGMGGHAAGEVASQEAVDTIYGMVKRGRTDLSGPPPVPAGEQEANRPPEDRQRARTAPEPLYSPTLTSARGAAAGPAPVSANAACRLLEGAVQAATYMVYAMAELDMGKSGMGTTISAMYRVDDRIVTAQVGDSRIYRIRGDAAEQLTEDHTLVAWQIKQGILTEEEAAHSKHKNVITRAVGNRDYVQVDTAVHDLHIGDAFLLCSDGLHGYLRAQEIPELVAEGGDAAVQRLIALANQRGGKDNITALLVEVS